MDEHNTITAVTDAEATLKGLARRTNLEHEEVEQHAWSAIIHARNAGWLLLEAKGRLKHGNWGGWLKANVKASAGTAQRYMRIASRWDEIEEKTSRVTDLRLRDALELLTTRRRKVESGKPPVPPATPDVGLAPVNEGEGDSGGEPPAPAPPPTEVGTTPDLEPELPADDAQPPESPDLLLTLIVRQASKTVRHSIPILANSNVTVTVEVRGGGPQSSRSYSASR